MLQSLEGGNPQVLNMTDLLAFMQRRGASDLHLTPGVPPMLRVDGAITATPFETLTPETSQSLVYSLLTEVQRKNFESHLELDLAIWVKGIGRLRINGFKQQVVV